MNSNSSYYHPSHDEWLDMVNEYDVVIGKKRRSEVYSEGLKNFRVVNAFLVNSQKCLWIPRRAAHKQIFPLCLDLSMGGHVESGESYDYAFKRELSEELNMQVTQVDVRLMCYLTPYNHAVSAFMCVYEIRTDETPDYNKNDFIESFWLSPQQVLERLDQGERAKDDLPKLIRYLYQ
ncbi:MAG: NUDIX domain-containing protein [Crinalium sp.]